VRTGLYAAFTQPIVRKKGSGASGVRLVRGRAPIGASSPITTSASGSTSWIARSDTRTSPRYRCGATGVQMPRKQADCGCSQPGWLGSFQIR
jgi:hypothetical protein